MKAWCTVYFNSRNPIDLIPLRFRYFSVCVRPDVTEFSNQIFNRQNEEEKGGHRVRCGKGTSLLGVPLSCGKGAMPFPLLPPLPSSPLVLPSFPFLSLTPLPV